MSQRMLPPPITGPMNEKFQECERIISSRKMYALGVRVFTYIVVPAILFFILAPGWILSVPEAKDCDTSQSKWVNPERVTWENSIVHSLIFAVVLALYFFIVRHVETPFETLGKLS